MLELDDKLKKNGRSDHDCKFYIQQDSDQVALKFQDGTELGILNNHTSKALEALLLRPSLQFDALSSAPVIREVISRATKASEAVIRVNINIYGPQEELQHVGSHLTLTKVYLQRPDSLRPGVTYENPHVLKFAGLPISNTYHQNEVQSSRVAASDDSDIFRKTVSNLYGSLTRGTKLDRIEGDSRLKTPLMT